MNTQTPTSPEPRQVSIASVIESAADALVTVVEPRMKASFEGDALWIAIRSLRAIESEPAHPALPYRLNQLVGVLELVLLRELSPATKMLVLPAYGEALTLLVQIRKDPTS